MWIKVKKVFSFSVTQQRHNCKMLRLFLSITTLTSPLNEGMAAVSKTNVYISAQLYIAVGFHIKYDHICIPTSLKQTLGRAASDQRWYDKKNKLQLYLFFKFYAQLKKQLVFSQKLSGPTCQVDDWKKCISYKKTMVHPQTQHVIITSWRVSTSVLWVRMSWKSK